MHAAREAVKVEHAGGLMRFIGDVGRIESKAGTRAALDSLKVAESPAEMSRFAKLAEKEGSKTRAIIKLLGRGAITLAAATIDLATWMLGALFSAFAVVSALKSMMECVAWRVVRHRRALRQHRRAHGAIGTMGNFSPMKIASAMWRTLVPQKSDATLSRIALAQSSR